MKELSIEEKAKAYDEAINTTINLVKARLIYEDTAIRIFPELAESKDERIREELIAMVKLSCTNGDDVDEKIAWFEKQGKKDEEILILKDQIESLHAAIKAIKETHRIELEKQGEWKPSNEQIEALKEVCDEHWEPDGLDPLYTLWEQLKKLTE